MLLGEDRKVLSCSYLVVVCPIAGQFNMVCVYTCIMLQAWGREPAPDRCDTEKLTTYVK